jgi:hypothetical protein
VQRVWVPFQPAKGTAGSMHSASPSTMSGTALHMANATVVSEILQAPAGQQVEEMNSGSRVCASCSAVAGLKRGGRLDEPLPCSRRGGALEVAAALLTGLDNQTSLLQMGRQAVRQSGSWSVK